MDCIEGVAQRRCTYLNFLTAQFVMLLSISGTSEISLYNQKEMYLIEFEKVVIYSVLGV